MRTRAPLLALVAGLLIGAVALPTAWAQFTSTVRQPMDVEVRSGNIAISTPDGGPLRVGVDDSVRLDVSATTPPDTFLAVAGSSAGARLEVDVPAGVAVSGTVELGPTSSALLAGRTCTYSPVGHLLVDAGVTEIPSTPGRTGVLLVGHSFGNSVDYVSCWPGVADAGPLPNCTLGSGGVGLPIHDQGSISFDVSSLYPVRCTVCAHSGGSGSTSAVISGANSQCTP